MCEQSISLCMNDLATSVSNGEKTPKPGKTIDNL